MVSDPVECFVAATHEHGLARGRLGAGPDGYAMTLTVSAAVQPLDGDGLPVGDEVRADDFGGQHPHAADRVTRIRHRSVRGGRPARR